MQTAHSSIELEQEKVIEEFSQFTDWSDKYEYLIDLGKALPALDEKYKTEFHLVKGCQSKVWLHAFVKENKLYLVADSDTVITKGIIALLIRVLNGQDILDIEKADLTFIEAIGLKSHLSPTRSNGLISMIQHIKSYARNLSITSQPEIASDPASQQALMIRQIKEVYDPEIPVDIWELGLIYTLGIDEHGKVQITMTLTSPACPVAGSLPLEVQEKLMQLPFVTDVELTLVWNPAWSKDRMSDEAKMALDMF
ncbi:MAG: SufE family protein [Saprospiraceae bacterium]|nr:SufE family protein [Candidatus Opimibacter skivensis]